MEDERIEDNQLSQSKSFIQFSSPTWGRLNGPKAWCASIALYYLSVAFIQVDFLKATWVTDIKTQGSEYHNAWVTRYSLKYKDSGYKFVLYQVYIVATKLMFFNHGSFTPSYKKRNADFNIPRFKTTHYGTFTAFFRSLSMGIVTPSADRERPSLNRFQTKHQQKRLMTSYRRVSEL